MRDRPGLGHALRLLILLGLALGTFAVAGCNRGFFQASGKVASSGGGLGTWRKTPDGCSRDPFDGGKIGASSSVVTFLWENPAVHDPLRDEHRETAGNAPLRLSIARAGQGFAGVLETVKQPPARLDGTVCGTLRMDTVERPAGFPEGRPTLGGRLVMDCSALGSHVTADVRFKRCEY